MNICEGFEVVSIAEEYLVIPVGDMAESFHGMAIINEAVAYLLENMRKRKSTTIDKLAELLEENYNVNRDRAHEDVQEMIDQLLEIGIISDAL